MASVSKSSDFSVSPERIWSQLTDVGSHGEWNVIHVGFPDGPPSEVAPSATYREQLRIMGFPAEVSWSVTEASEPSLLSMTGQGPMGTQLTLSYRVEPIDGGARLTIENEVEGGALSAMSGAVASATGQALGESLEKLRSLVAGP